MRIRLDPQDEYMHPLDEASNFNESMYFNVFDPTEQIGGFLRLGNRANEGYAEMTVCLYLPGGRVGFMFKRPPITSNERLDAGGLTWEVVTPFEELRVRYSGRVVVLEDPTQMADPKRAFTDNPHVPCEAELTFTGQGRDSMFGGEPDRPGHPGALGLVDNPGLEVQRGGPVPDGQRRFDPVEPPAVGVHPQGAERFQLPHPFELELVVGHP